jgi:pimeloyl-ACP methyl ester carboxylesterase
MKTIFSFFVVLWGVSVISNVSHADIRLFEVHRQNQIAKQYEVLKQSQLASGQSAIPTDFKGAQEFTVEQKLVHNNSDDKRTFSQRYYINEDYAGPVETSPVLLFICGESVCNPNRSILEQANKLGARVVYVEHRYYGKSLPMTKLTTENLKYLSTDMALKDLKEIQLYLQREKHFTGKWIAVGGSYAGSLSAYYRLKYPDLVSGALASSGPVMAKENFEIYDRHVSKVVGPSCGEKMRQVVKEIEAVLDQPTKLAEIKRKFRGQELTDNVDFLYLVADMGAFAVQYGSRDHFCELVDSADPLNGYAQYTRETMMMYGMTAIDMSVQGAMNEDISSENSNMRQWFYQSCTEYGYWQNAYHDKSISVRSALINPAYHKHICQRLFGLDISGNEDAINKTYYEPLLDPKMASNIFFTNGSTDPWLNLSIAKENKNVLNDRTPVMTIEGASHCNDLQMTADPEISKAREKFVELASEWIK